MGFRVRGLGFMVGFRILGLGIWGLGSACTPNDLRFYRRIQRITLGNPKKEGYKEPRSLIQTFTVFGV